MASLASMRTGRRIGHAACVLAISWSAAHAQDSPSDRWLTLGRTPARLATNAQTAMPDLTEPSWRGAVGPGGDDFRLSLASGAVVADGRVIVPGTIGGQDVLGAFDASTGAPLWATEVPPPVFDSWATPSIDAGNGQVVHASDFVVTSLDVATGQVRWQTELVWDAVNVSPAITWDLGPRDRAFVTDFDPFVGEGSLYCINVDPFDPVDNPYEPGQIVWVREIGDTGGASPAYADGVVYVATTGASGSGAGRIMAFDAQASGAPPAMWEFTNVIDAGFFGPVVVVGVDGASWVYAASFGFFGGRTGSNLVKLDASNGALLWSIASNRTNTAPVVLADGRVVVSGGLWGFGTVPTLQMFEDRGASAEMVWDSAADTWTDSDSDGVMEPGEFLAIGGWTVQPAAATPGALSWLAVGVLEPGGADFAPPHELVLIDLDADPGSFGFVRARSTDADHDHIAAGGSPAFTEELLIVSGPDGPIAYRTGRRFDVDRDGLVSVDDLHAWEQGRGERDVDADGAVDASDREALIAALRAGEAADMTAGRR